MTSYTITCPLTRGSEQSVSTTALQASRSFNQANETVLTQDISQSGSSQTIIDAEGNTFQSFTSESEEEFALSLPSAPEDGGPSFFILEDAGVIKQSATTLRTFGSDGGLTIEESAVRIEEDIPFEQTQVFTESTRIVYTSAESTSSQQTTIATTASEVFTFVITASKTIEVGTLQNEVLSTGAGATTALTTATESQEKTITITTTQAATYAVWGHPTQTAPATNRGVFGVATVVIPDTNEEVWEITQPLASTAFLAQAATRRAPVSSNITILPSITTQVGAVLSQVQSTIGVGEDTFTQMANTTSVSVEVSPATYTTTAIATQQISIANLFGNNALIPPEIQTVVGSAVVAASYGSNRQTTSYTGAHVEDTFINTTLTFAGVRGAITYNDTFTRHTVVKSTVPFKVQGQSSETGADEEEGNSFYFTQSGGYAQQWQYARGLRAAAFGGIIPHAQDQSVFVSAMAVPSDYDKIALQVFADGLTVRAPGGYPQAKRTAFLPMAFIGNANPDGTWSYLSGDSSISVSADGAGMTETKSELAIGSATKSGSWATNGEPVTTVARRANAINPGGRAAAGNSVTVTRRAGVHASSDEGGSGTFSVATAFTFLQPPSDPRVAFSSVLKFSRPFANEGSRYFVSQRNQQTVVGEQLLIL